ncbi:MAG: hypothetical protein FWE80_07075, partial [Oscillospiraceae bacterium]|nr:hypothetical protein [Oscillospiraceae bacterium]
MSKKLTIKALCVLMAAILLLSAMPVVTAMPGRDDGPSVLSEIKTAIGSNLTFSGSAISCASYVEDIAALNNKGFSYLVFEVEMTTAVNSFSYFNIGTKNTGAATDYSGANVQTALTNAANAGETFYITLSANATGTNGFVFNFWAQSGTFKFVDAYMSNTPRTLGSPVLPPTPDIPQNLRVTAKSAVSISLAWDAADGAESYNIYRDGVLIETVTGTTYTDGGLDYDTTYTYEIAAVNYAGESDRSDPVSATTNPQDLEPPTVPLNLSVISVRANSVSLTWDASDDNDMVAGYDIFRDGVKVNSALITGLSYTDIGLSPETTYSYQVEAVDASGNRSGKSAAVKATTTVGQTIIGTGAFRLTAENQGIENYIKLFWDIAGLPSDKNFGYTIYQSGNGGGDWEIRSASYGKPIKVLNIYPNTAGSCTLKGWMEDEPFGPVTVAGQAGRGSEGGANLISVETVSISNASRAATDTVWEGSAFNANPDAYLKDSEGNYKYDAIMFGTWDSFNGQDLSPASAAAVEAFLKTGRGVLFGHDTIVSYHPNFRLLANYANISFPAGAKELGSHKVEPINDGYLLQYPWSIDMNSILTVPFTHAGSHIAKGTIWMKFCEVNGRFGEHADGSYQSNFSGPEHNDPNDGKGTNNYYLTTFNNTAMTQAGHSSGQSSIDEQRIIANTLFYLAQFTTGTQADDRSARDTAAPNVPEHSFSGNTLSLTASDNGTPYDYYIKATNLEDNADVYESDHVREFCTTGLKGYYILESSNPDDAPVIERNQNGDIITPVTISATDNV